MSATDSVDSTWSGLYRVGGTAALICSLMYLATLGIYLWAYRAAPPPATVSEWFAFLRMKPVAGLFLLGLADIVIMILWGPMSLALCGPQALQ